MVVKCGYSELYQNKRIYSRIEEIVKNENELHILAIMRGVICQMKKVGVLIN